MFEHIASYGLEENTTVKLISFNGSNFDDYLLLDHVSKFDYKVDAVFSGKSILGMRFRNFECWDLNKFLTGSLATNCKSFNTTIKKIDGFEHSQF